MFTIIVRSFDHHYRHWMGIEEFCDNPECVFRIAIISSPARFSFPSGVVVERGAPIGKLHFFNERLSLLYSLRGITIIRRSLNALADALTNDAKFKPLVAVGATYFTPQHSILACIDDLGFETVTDKAYPFLGGWLSHLRGSVYSSFLKQTFTPNLGPKNARWCPPVPLWMSAKTLKERHGKKLVSVSCPMEAA